VAPASGARLKRPLVRMRRVAAAHRPRGINWQPGNDGSIVSAFNTNGCPSTTNAKFGRRRTAMDRADPLALMGTGHWVNFPAWPFPNSPSAPRAHGPQRLPSICLKQGVAREGAVMGGDLVRLRATADIMVDTPRPACPSIPAERPELWCLRPEKLCRPPARRPPRNRSRVGLPTWC